MSQFLFTNETAGKSQDVAKHQLTLYGVRNHLHRPDRQTTAYSALASFINGGKSASLQLVEELQGFTCLLNNRDVLDIAKQALSGITDPNGDEAQLLKRAVGQIKADCPIPVQCLLDCPAFVEKLKGHAGDKKRLAIVSNCCLPLREAVDIIHTIPITVTVTVPAVSEEKLADTKQAFEKIQPQSLKEHLETSMEQMAAALSKGSKEQEQAQGGNRYALFSGKTPKGTDGGNNACPSLPI